MDLRIILAMALAAASITDPLQAQVIEPKEAKTASAIKADEGVVRLSLRSQRQFIQTAYLYLVEVLSDGSDGKRILQFERGAGVPVMGTNMIDVKTKYYRVPQGKYRLLAYTIACRSVPLLTPLVALTAPTYRPDAMKVDHLHLSSPQHR